MRAGHRLAIVTIGWLALTAGCATPSMTRGPDGVAGTATDAEGDAPAVPSEQAQILTAVLREYLPRGANGYRTDRRFPVAYVLDRTDRAAADPMGGPEPGAPIPPDDQAAILAATADLGPIEFIADRASVIDDSEGCATVRGGGVLIVLGPAVPVGDHMEVAFHAFVACLGAEWFTYVVERDGAGWRTNGTTGSYAIA